MINITLFEIQELKSVNFNVIIVKQDGKIKEARKTKFDGNRNKSLTLAILCEVSKRVKTGRERSTTAWP